MTVLLVLAFLAVAYGVVRQARLLAAGRQGAPAGTASVSLTLAPGVRIVSAAAEGGRLVLHVRGPAGDEVQVIDMASGTLVSQVRTQTAQ
jgi:hypothetical protein